MSADDAGTDAFWTPDGEFMLPAHGDTARRWQQGDNELELVDLPSCRPPLAPVTTSSRVAADGRMVCGNDELDVVAFEGDWLD